MDINEKEKSACSVELSFEDMGTKISLELGDKVIIERFNGDLQVCGTIDDIKFFDIYDNEESDD